MWNYISVLLGISYNFPNGDRVMIGDCLNKCPQRVRCMGKPTLRNLAQIARIEDLRNFP